MHADFEEDDEKSSDVEANDDDWSSIRDKRDRHHWMQWLREPIFRAQRICDDYEKLAACRACDAGWSHRSIDYDI